MPTITAIQHMTRHSGRRQIELDNGDTFSLDVSLLVRHGIRVGMELDDSTRTAILAEDACLRAKASAFDFLRMRNMSRKEMTDRLTRKGFDDDAVTYAVGVLENLDYLSDEKVADEFVGSRLRSKPKGVAGLRKELKKKGIDRQTIERTLATITVEDERGAALALGKKQMKRYRTLPLDVALRRVRDFLLRRGFPFDAVRASVKEFTEAWEAEHVVTPMLPEGRPAYPRRKPETKTREMDSQTRTPGRTLARKPFIRKRSVETV